MLISSRENMMKEKFNIFVIGGEYRCGIIYPLAVEGLRRAGHQASGFGYLAASIKRPWLLKLANAIGMARIAPGLHAWFEKTVSAIVDLHYQRYNFRKIREAIHREKYDIVLVIRGDNITAEMIREIKNDNPECLTAIWFLDDPLISWSNPPQILQTSLSAMPEYDVICSFDDYYLPQLHSHLGKKVMHLPLAYDEKDFYPQPEVEKRYAAGIVGVAMPKRLEVLRAVDGVKVFGPGWPADMDIGKNGVLNGAEVKRTYNETRINLNITHQQSIWDYNNKLFEITGSGGFLITEYKKNLEKHFVIGKEIESFASVEELREKINYYLQRPEKVAMIAAAAQRRALRDHTYGARMSYFIDQLRDVIAVRQDGGEGKVHGEGIEERTNHE